MFVLLLSTVYVLVCVVLGACIGRWFGFWGLLLDLLYLGQITVATAMLNALYGFYLARETGIATIIALFSWLVVSFSTVAAAALFYLMAHPELSGAWLDVVRAATAVTLLLMFSFGAILAFLIREELVAYFSNKQNKPS